MMDTDVVDATAVATPDDAALNNPMQNELTVIRKAGRQAVRQFLSAHPCFNVLRTSGKVVVFDTRIPIQLAFYAVVEHGACTVAVLCWWLLHSVGC